MYKRTDLYVYLLLILLIFVAVFTITQRQLIVPLLNSWNVLPRKEKLTELAFSDVYNIPNRAKIREVIPVRFSIHNVEQQDMLYPYEVTIATEGGKMIQAKGVIHVRNGRTAIIEELVKVNTNKTGKVTVELLNKKQKISFWINK